MPTRFIVSVLPLVFASACDRAAPAPLSQHDNTPAQRPDTDDDAQTTPAGKTPPVAPLSSGARIEYEQNTIDVFSAVAPATVFVTQNRLVRDRWSMRALEVPAGSGSGFIWDRQGHVVTNYHVIDRARSISVTLYGGKVFPATLVGGDPKKDIAVIKIDAPEHLLTAVRLGAADSPIEVGQKALAIGNPFGLDHTLTVGVISATGREVKGYGGVTIRDMLQTDAAINQGNSGGPLLDSAGQLIGMNTMIYSKTGGSTGVGFAVPSSTIRRVVPQIIKHGKPQRAGLGVELVSDDIARSNGVVGCVIEAVPRGTPADRAGLKGLVRTRQGVFLGDVIVGIDTHEVKNFDDLYNALDRYEPGDTVAVKILREDKKETVNVTLMQLP